MTREHLRWVLRLVVLAGLAMLVLLPGAAWAQDEGNYPPSSTSTTTECTEVEGSQVCGTQVTVSQERASLPFTGGDVALMTLVGLAAAGAGAGLVWVGRRSDSTT